MNRTSLTTCAVFAALALACGAPEAAEKDAGLTIHEWGTFTTFSGSDGKPIGFFPASTDLPSFVHRAWEKGARTTLVSLETPVLYAYTPTERTFSVTANFPQGRFTESYPSADVSYSTIVWKDLHAKPELNTNFPDDKQRISDRYFRARETDAVPLETSGKDAEREKFLFYRGAGDAHLPVRLQALTSGATQIKNEFNQALPAALLVSVKHSKLFFSEVGPIAAGAAISATLPASDSTRAQLAEALIKALTAQGLFEKEARAMVKTWDDAWFQEEGSRLMYLLPAQLTEELLPMKVEPAPEKLVRVMVGRLEFITPEQEKILDDSAVANANTLNFPERFYEAAHRAAQARVKNATSATSHP